MAGAGLGAVVAMGEGGVIGVSCASMAGAVGVGFFGASVTADVVVGVVETGAVIELGVFGAFAAVVAVIGAVAFSAALLTGPVAGLIASAEISARTATAAIVNLFVIDAIISVA